MDSAMIQAQKEYSTVMAASRLLPQAYVGKPENIFVAVEYGKALGLPPIEAINSVNVIQGKPTMSANLMAALVRRAGCKLRITQHGRGEEAAVQATLIRPDDPDFAFTAVWNKEKAQRAGVWGGKGAWRTYPDQMLRNRAITEVCRMGASDFLMGVVYDPEELGAVPRDGHGGVQVSEVVVDGGEARGDAGVSPSPAPAAAETVEDAEVVTEADSGSDAEARRLEAVAAIYEQADGDGYEPERLAAAVAWASGQRTQLVDDLTGEEASRLLTQMRAMNAEGGEQE